MSHLWITLSPPWRACLEEAWAACCAGSLPIGAAIVDPSGAVIARGRNGVFDAAASDQPLAGNRIAHAELNALGRMDHEAPWESCALYTTMEPCVMCVGAIRMCRIGEVHYAARDPIAGAARLLESVDYMRGHRCRLHGPDDPHLESVLVGLFVDCGLHLGILRSRQAKAQALIESLRAMTCEGVQLGEELHESGGLARLRAGGAGAEAAFALLEESLAVR